MQFIGSNILNIIWVAKVCYIYFTRCVQLSFLQPDHIRDHNTFDPQDESERPFISQVPNIRLSPPTEYPTTTPTRRSPI